MRRIRLKTAAVTGSIDCALRLALRFIPPPFLRRGGGRVCLRLWLQTLFDGYVPAFAATPPMSGCWHAPLRCQPGNLRLQFRLTRTVIFSPSSGRRTSAIRHHPPTHKWTDERTEISPWHSLIYRRGQNVGGFRFRPHPERCLCNGI